MTGYGTNLPIRNVRYMAAFGGDPDIEPRRGSANELTHFGRAREWHGDRQGRSAGQVVDQARWHRRHHRRHHWR
jgi:hypothetical protein